MGITCSYIDFIFFSSSSVGGRSDTKKENISLRSELTEALKSLEKLRQEHNDLTEK